MIGVRRDSGRLEAASLVDLGHQLRAPLAVISGYAELLATRDDEATRTEAPLRILAASDRLSNLIDDLLTALALELGELPLDRRSIDVVPEVERAAARVRERGGTVTVSTERGAHVDADPTYVVHIVRNLIELAATLSDEPVAVDVVVAASADAVEIAITAAGRALTHEQQRAISASSSGTGFAALGLYTARRLVELHGGSLRAAVSSSRTTLSFVLPRAPAAGSG